ARAPVRTDRGTCVSICSAPDRSHGLGRPPGGHLAWVRAAPAGPGRGRGGLRAGVTSEESAEVKPFKVETERLRDDDEILAPGLEFFAGELAPATADPRAHRRDAHRGLCSRVDP